MKLFSRVLGQGQPMIIMHGLFGMSDNWQSLAKQLSLFFEVHLLDLRNHGQSPHSKEFNQQLIASDLALYISDNKLDDVILVGHSLGGKGAMTFAVSHPMKLQKLVIVDISPRYYPVHHDTIIQALFSLDFNELKSRQQANAQLSKLIQQEDMRQFLLKSIYWKQKGQLALRFNLTSIAENISKIGESLDQQATFTKPTLFLKGEYSNYIIDDDEEVIFHHFPDAVIETIRDSGHWLHAQNPKQFLDVVCRFCL